MMLEIPEARVIARQLKETVLGKTITHAVAATSPHSFTWYFGDPTHYGAMLNGKKITDTAAFGGLHEIWAEDIRIAFCDGANVRFFGADKKRPSKHQLMLEFGDGCAVCCTVQMLGGISMFPDGMNNNYYYTVAKEKPSPLSDCFDAAYFSSLLTSDTVKLSAKAFLATEQRIPGLGNGTLQDILWRTKIHPKRKMNTISDSEYEYLFKTVKTLLMEITEKGGRDTEKDLFGNTCGYETILSRNRVGMPCPACGCIIKRMAYLGGNVYVCEGCQGTY